MKSESSTIVFFGSGPVAAASLELLAQDFNIEAVVTKPRPVHHIGSVPVIEIAEKLGLKVCLASNKQELNELFETVKFTSQLGVLIDFGIIVSQQVIDCFALGIINSHFSVLPQWRGADPITFAILSGQEQTGVSLMQLVAGMDEGPLLSYGLYDLPGDINNQTLSHDLINLSFGLLKACLPEYIKGAMKLAPQSVTGFETSYSRKLTKEDGELDFNKPALVLEREIRAYSSWPKSRTRLCSNDIVITKSHVIEGSDKPGKLWHSGKQFGFYTSKDVLVIDELIPAGKKNMSAISYLAGHKELF